MSLISKAIGSVTGKNARREAAAQAARQQAEFDRTKQSLLDEEAEITKQKDVEKKKIEAKQIRSLRRGFRAPGFLDAPTNEVSDKLG